MYYYPRIPNFISCLTIEDSKTRIDFYRSLIKLVTFIFKACNIKNFILYSESLIPHIELNDNSYYNDLDKILNFFNSNVTATEELAEKFEKFFASGYSRGLYCGV